MAAYADAAFSLGQEIAQRGLGMIYGGASVGLMNETANGALAAGGKVIGILPEWLEQWEVAHDGLTELRIVASMHERKAQMADLSDAFVVLPGGIGSLEECFEVWTWSQLGIHRKPIGLLNVAGYYESLASFLDHIVAEQFLKREHREMLLAHTDPASLLDALFAQEIPDLGKWVER